MHPPRTDHWISVHVGIINGSQRLLELSVELRTPEGVQFKWSWDEVQAPWLSYWLWHLLQWSASDPGWRESPELQSLTGFLSRELSGPLGRLRETLPRDRQSVSLPLFFSADPDLPIASLFQLLRAAVATERGLPMPLEIVAAPHRFPREPLPLRLPIRITGFGGLSIEHVLESLISQAWYLRDPAVHDFALRVDKEWPANRRPGEIVVTIEEYDPFDQIAGRREPGKDDTRLVIALVRETAMERIFQRLHSIAGIPAVAVIPANDLQLACEDLRWFIEEIVHDCPLHEAMHRLRRRRFHDPDQERIMAANNLDSDGFQPFLWADPASNQGLRLSSALPQVVDAANRVRIFSAGADISGFTEKVTKIMGSGRAKPLADLLARVDQVATPFAEVLGGTISFDQEGRGLVPMARLAAATAQLSAIEQTLQPQIDALVRQPEIVAALEVAQDRKVDARLFRRAGPDTSLSLDGYTGLEEAMPLRLSVQIGQRADGSLVIGDAPSLDPLLPPFPNEESHVLQIIVFPKDFRLESPATQSVTLSRFGGTTPVEWDLVTPRVLAIKQQDTPATATGADDISPGRGWVATPEAELRFGVYLKNQLLQSFRLRAVLGEGPPIQAGRRVIIECDFSQTRRFGGLERLGERAISLGLNRDSTASHTLTIVKSGQPPVSLAWTEGQMAKHTEAIRRALSEVTAIGAPTNPFPFASDTLELRPTTGTTFGNAVRKLAVAGASLYTQLFLRNRAARDLLKSLSQTGGQILQIARHDADYAFPWPLLYDFPQPGDDTSTAVCTGRDSDGNPCRCGSQLSPDHWCLRGFWGFRHVVEQLCDGPAPLDGIPGRIADAAVVPAIGVVPAVTDRFVDSWLSKWQSHDLALIPANLQPPNFLSWIRDGARRPPLVVFIGHHLDNGHGGIPDPRLALADGTTVLSLHDVRDELQHHDEWAAPRSLVLLLACGSGTQRVDTGTSLAAALLQLGAVGVLATECAVRTGVASRLARDLTTRLAAREKIGHALRESILQLATEGCPLGLAFTYLGSADAQLPS